MASLKCNNCGFGIHYNDLPNGIEHTFISFSTWEHFKSTDTPISRIILDGEQDYLIVWRCPECSCLHTFVAGSPQLEKAYAKTNFQPPINTFGKKFLVFVDYLYEKLADSGITAKSFVQNEKNTKCQYAIVSNEHILISETPDFNSILECYKAID